MERKGMSLKSQDRSISFAAEQLPAGYREVVPQSHTHSSASLNIHVLDGLL